jgi:hypothetical protein
MIHVSLLLNIVVLIPVCLMLIRNNPQFTAIYGGSTPARQILMSIYIAILVLSIFLLVVPNKSMALSLFLVQIIYKLLTAWTVKDIKNPVVQSNLFIAVVHIATVATIYLGS